MNDNFSNNCFQISNGTLVKFDQSKNLGRTITVPKDVSIIGEKAFQNCLNVENIVLPDTVKIISNNAFQSCVNLRSVAMPFGITEIYDNAFTGCSSLTSIELPESLIKIGKSIFSGCKKLKPIDFSNKNIEYKFYKGFEIQNNNLTYFDQTINTDQNLYIPNGIKTIGERAFSKCTNLIVVTIPRSVEAIENCAFADCTNLCVVDFPMDLLNIGRGIFAKCTQLMPIKMANRLTSYYFANGLEIHDRCLTFFDESINKSQNLILPNGVTSIGEYAFQGCTKVKSITYPKNFKMIEEGAFANSSLQGSLVPSDIMIVAKKIS